MQNFKGCLTSIQDDNNIDEDDDDDEVGEYDDDDLNFLGNLFSLARIKEIKYNI